MKRRYPWSFISMFLFALFSCHASFAQGARPQSPCPQLTNLPILALPDTADRRLICTLPEVYGPQGFFVGDVIVGGAIINTSGGGGSLVSFQGNFLSSVNESVATQIALLPLVAPAAGISLVFDKSLGVYTASDDSFGPIFSERASTIGRHRLGIGFSYQYLSFNSLDGIGLQSFPTVFLQNLDSTGQPCDPTKQNGNCILAHDYINASNRIDLTISQYSTFATFGITRHIDLSVAVPILTVRMNAAANSILVPNSGFPGLLAFGANATAGFRGSNGTCLAMGVIPGINQSYCAQAIFFNSQRASGIGDVTVRAKAEIKKWEHSALALGLDVRVPTGDEKNFLGTGAIGIKPFAIWSYGGRISPHVNIGYEWNGRSFLAGDVVAGTKDNLPGEFLYSVGVEAGITKRLTGSFDLIGQTVIDGSRIRLVNTQVPGLCMPLAQGSPCLTPGQQETAEGFKGTYAIDNASLGFRYRPVGKFLISASVQLKLDNGGLRSKAIPLVSATYTIH